jgi:hypothetical protein
MAGLVPAIHVLLVPTFVKTRMAATWTSEATPFFERLSAGMTASLKL